MDIKNITINNNRELKSRQTREKIVSAAKALMKEYGYEQLTIRNICQVAEVSNGSFYHFFKSKEDLMGEFLRQGPLEDTDRIIEEYGLVEFIIRIYERIADQIMELGIEFTGRFYTPGNPIFDFRSREAGAYSTDLYMDRLEEAIRDGHTRPGIDAATVKYDIQVLVLGNIFEWSTFNGRTDLHSNLRHMLNNYLIKHVFTPEYTGRFELLTTESRRVFLP